MALRHEPSRIRWWSEYANRLGYPPEEVNKLVRIAARIPSRYPHVRSRLVLGEPEAYIPGTGLAIWEISWLDRVYSGKTEDVVEHLGISASLVEEALAYARAHPSEIDPVIQYVEEGSLERLQAILPGIQVIDVEVGPESGLAP